MKKIILYIDYMQRGGAQRVMNNLANYFVSQKIDTILINDFEIEDKTKEYKVCQDVKRYYLDKKNSNRVKKNFLRVNRLRKIIKHEKPDIVISFLGPPNFRMLVSTIGIRVKKIVSVRNDPYKEYGKGIKKLITNGIFLLANGCIFQTEEAAMYFSQAIRNKSCVIYNPVDKRFYMEKYIGDNKEIIMVGRLHHQKRPELLLEAFAKISNKFTDYYISYYGTGYLQAYLQSLIKELKIENRVFFRGQTDEIEAKLSHAKVFVLASDYEGMPNALMEAMAVGVPCISTDCPCGGPKEIIRNSKQGILITCGNVDELAFALEKILGNQTLQKTLSFNAKERAEEFYPDIIFGQWYEYLKNVLKE